MAFLVPFLWFLRRGWIPPRRRAALWTILALGGLQGAIGWWMVASGLADRVEVWLRAGHAYNIWPLIDGGFIPRSSSLLFEVPLWRNLFENPLTVQFDHRMLGYLICAVALLHLFNVVKWAKRGPMVAGAALLAAAIIVQGALGIWTLLSVAALPLALLHQAVAMIALTFAVAHAANAVPRRV